MVMTIAALLAAAAYAPVRLVVDTDMGGGGCRDVDDVAAVCLANALADSGEAELLAVVTGGTVTEHLENLRTAGRRSVAGKGGSSLAGLRSRLSWLKHLPGGRWLARATRGH